VVKTMEARLEAFYQSEEERMRELERIIYLQTEEGIKREIAEEGEKRGEKRGKEQGIEIGLKRGEKRGIEIGLKKGEKRGIKEGKKQGNLSMIKDLLILKLGTLSEVVINKINHIEPQQLSQLKSQFYDIQTEKDLLDILK